MYLNKLFLRQIVVISFANVRPFYILHQTFPLNLFVFNFYKDSKSSLQPYPCQPCIAGFTLIVLLLEHHLFHNYASFHFVSPSLLESVTPYTSSIIYLTSFNYILFAKLQIIFHISHQPSYIRHLSTILCLQSYNSFSKSPLLELSTRSTLSLCTSKK